MRYFRSTVSFPESILRPANLPEYGVSRDISTLRKATPMLVNALGSEVFSSPSIFAVP